MSAQSIHKRVVESYEGAHRELQHFDVAVQGGKEQEAAEHLHRAAQAICWGLTAVVEDPEFWAEMANRLTPEGEAQAALTQALSDLDSLVAEEGRVLEEGGFSRPGISQLLGEFACTLRTFKRLPTGDTLVLAQRRVSDVRRVVCELSNRPVTVEKSFWRRTFRIVKVGIKVLGGVGTIVADLSAAPLVVPVAVISVVCGIDMLVSVGDVFE
jgi:hypothetical protein